MIDLAAVERQLAEQALHLVALRQRLHRHPELAFAEHRSAELVVDRLRAAGLEVQAGVAGTGVVAALRGARPGPTVAWRADLDALPIDEPAHAPFSSEVPGVMHACGHDGHVALAVIVAELLAQYRAQLTGTVVFLFQPAEEIFAGAARMLAAGALDAPRVAAVFGLHLTTHLPPGQVAIGAGPMWAAADLFEIELLGQGAHGAYPHLGKNPILALAALIGQLSSLVAQEVAASESVALSFGALRAGDRPNVIPDRASVSGSLRTLAESTRAFVKQRIAELADAVAAAHRVTAQVRFSASCAGVDNDATCAAIAQRAARAALGAAAVITATPSLASDDISAMLQARPGCYFRAGIGPASGPPPAHHSKEFRMDEAGLLPAAQVTVRVLLEALASLPASEGSQDV